MSCRMTDEQARGLLWRANRDPSKLRHFGEEVADALEELLDLRALVERLMAEDRIRPAGGDDAA